MNQQELKKQATIKKRVGCSLTDCGQYFTFTISEHVLALSDHNKRLYIGKCVRCHNSVKLKADDCRHFEAVYGQTNYIVSASTFDGLFDQDET